MQLGQRAMHEARKLGGEALLLGSYKTLGLKILLGLILHLAATCLAIVAILRFLPLASCEQGCFRPGLEFCCLGNSAVLSVWAAILFMLGVSSWLSTRLIAQRDFGVSAAVTALVVVTFVIYFGVVGYAFSELVFVVLASFCASYAGFRLAYLR